MFGLKSTKMALEAQERHIRSCENMIASLFNALMMIQGKAPSMQYPQEESFTVEDKQEPFPGSVFEDAINSQRP